MAVETRLPLPPQREGRARQTRHRDAQVPHGDFRERVFLARARCSGYRG